MDTNKLYTLWDILSNKVDGLDHEIPYGIEIPMIQRDYAQGRETEKPTLIREKFLGDIHSQLLSYQTGVQIKEPLKLDFIYGYVSGGKFVPLDGQQRLTTLYLVQWFIFFKDRTLISHLNTFKNISYKSRVSSREFFEKINSEKNLIQIYLQRDKAELNGENLRLAELLQNQNWFRGYWIDDPTIRSVLKMLSDIENKFKDIAHSILLEQRPLCFNLLIIDDHGLGDSMYIKMNARGKGLTDFENFKAIMEGVFSETDKELQKQFSESIDKQWLDQVWRFGIDIKSNEERSQASGKYLLQLITSISELIFHDMGMGEHPYQFNEKLLYTIYNDSKNIKFLISCLDQICVQSLHSYDQYFASIYSLDVVVGKIRYDGKFNMIAEVLKGAPADNTDKLLYFAWLIYIFKTGSRDVSINLKDYLRICRNYLNSINQSNKREFNLTTNIRTENFNEIIEVFKGIFDHVDVYQALVFNQLPKNGIKKEIIKAQLFERDAGYKVIIQQLEDHEVFRGQIFNLDLEQYSVSQLQIIVGDFFDLFATIKDSEIVQLLICLGYSGVSIAWTSLGTMKLWGKRERWHRVMATPDGEIRPIIARLFEFFLQRDRSNGLIDEVNDYITTYKNGLDRRTMSWYWLEYPVMLESKLYTIKDEKLKIPLIERFDSSSIIGYHINPFVLIVKELPEVKHLLNLPSCYSRHSSLSKVQLLNGLSLYQDNCSWVLHNAVTQEGLDEVITEFNLDFFDDNLYRFNCEHLIHDVIPLIKACAELQGSNVIKETAIA
jgi:hypothetical protein